MLKTFIGVAAVLMLLPYSELAALLVLVWIFWEKLGNLTLRVYDDYQRNKTETVLKESLSDNVRGIRYTC